MQNNDDLQNANSNEYQTENVSQKHEKLKPPKKGISIFSMILTVILINAVWVAAAVLFFVPAYKDAVYVRDNQIAEYETQLKEIKTNQTNSIEEYKKRIDELEKQLNEQQSSYENAIKLIEKYSSGNNNSSGNNLSQQGGQKQ